MFEEEGRGKMLVSAKNKISGGGGPDTLTVRSGQNEGRAKRGEKGKRRGRKRKLHPILTHNLRNEGKLHTADTESRSTQTYINSRSIEGDIYC
jgi:hypothetical protein